MPNVEIRLKLAVAVLVMASYFSLASTYRYGQLMLFVPALTLAFMPVGERLDRKYGWYRQITSAAVLFFLFSLPVIVQTFALLDAVVSVVMFVQIYSLIHVKRERNYGHVMLMSFFLVLAASVLSPRAGIGLAYLFFVLFAAWALSLLEMFSSQRLAEGSRAEPVRLQDAKGRRTFGEPGRYIGLQMTPAVLMSSFLILGMTGVLFLVTPRTDAGFMGTMQSAPQFTTGLASEVDLTIAGRLSTNAGPVMRVQFPEEPGGRYDAPKLWRSTALDSYRGTSWVRRGLSTRSHSTARFKSDHRITSVEGLKRNSYGLGRVVYHEIFLDRPPESGIPVLQMVREILPGDANRPLEFRWDEAGDFTARMRGSTESGVSLRVWSEVVEMDPEMLRASSTRYLDTMVLSDLRHLTYQNLLPETLSLVEELTQNASTVYDKVTELAYWLEYRGGFSYTRDIPPLPHDHPVDAFILRERSGHCELYASALALMARSLGIPARVVSGYRGGVWDEGDRSYTVTNDMAHLWTEIYFPDVGWMPFDPSPPTESPGRFTMGSFARSYARYVLKARLLWQSHVVSYRPGAGSIFSSGSTIGAVGFLGAASGTFALPDTQTPILNGVKGPLFAAGLAGVLLATMLVLRRTRGRVRARVGELTPDQRRALRVHRLLLRRMRHIGLDCRGMTAEEMGEEVSQLSLNHPDSATNILSAYSASRFGRRGLTPARFKELCRAVRGLRIVVQ